MSKITGTAAQFNTACSDDTFSFISDKLDIFAATTSAELATVISDETGSGGSPLLVFNQSPVIVTPTIASFANSAHDHSDAAGGGNLTTTALTTGVFVDITGLGTQTQDMEFNGFNIQTIGVLTIKEQADADGDIGGEGQLWVNTATPNELWFTDDTGIDQRLGLQALIVAVSDEITLLTTGTAKTTFRMPYAMKLREVRASLTTAATGATLVTVDINETGSTILSTKITIDASETTSQTAATAPVISDTVLADDAVITIDIDAVGNTTAGKGLKISLIGNPQ